MTKRPDRTGRKLRWPGWRTVWLVALQVVIAVVALEIILRVVGPRTGLRRLTYQPSAAAYFESADTIEELLDRSIIGFQPHTESYGYVLNSRGLRAREYEEENRKDVYRVLAFGDSFTWASGGLPHDQHWPTILEKRLHGSLGLPVEVLRMGVPATGPDFQYRLWQIEGSRLEPDLVVLAFFVGNDFVDHRGWKATKGLRDHPKFDVLSDNSFIFRIARNLARVLRSVASDHGHGLQSGTGEVYDRGGYPIAEYGEAFRPNRPSFGRKKFLAIESRNMALCLEENEIAFEDLLDRVVSKVVAFRREVNDIGARFVVLVIPDEYQVNRVMAENAAASQGRTIDEYDLDRPNRRLAGALGEEGVDVLDLTREFRRAGARGRLYRVRDTHWNHAGNRLAAELLDRHITDARADTVVGKPRESISEIDFEGGDLGGFWPSPAPGSGSGEIDE